MIGRLLKYVAISLICCAAPGITRSAVVGTGSTPCTLSRIIQCAFIPDGYFYMKGGSPAGFEDFDHLELWVTTDKGRRRTPADSRLYTRDGKPYKFTKLTKSGAHPSGWGITFEFETEMIEGVSYKFRGRFVRICDFAEEVTDPKKAVVEGQITKLRGGKEVATAQVQFTYSKSLRSRLTTHSTGAASGVAFIHKVDCRPVNSGVRFLSLLKVF